MMGQRYDSLIFDWGGVFQCTVDRGPRRQLERELGLGDGEIDERVFAHPLWNPASVGKVDAGRLWRAICSSLACPVEQVETFVRRFFAGDLIDQQLVQLVRRLRRQGITVGLLSNAPPPLMAEGQAGRWGTEGLFDVQVFSYRVGVLKPHVAMYETVLRELGVAPQRALFIDDAPSNIDGAQALGISSILFQGTSQLLEALTSFGIL